MKHTTITLLICCLVLAAGCRTDDTVIYSIENEVEGMTRDAANTYSGMYVLNEGNMGSNKCTLDYLDFAACTYSRNIYSERNPNVVKELGDVGNDIEIYNGRMYMVINCSNKVEVVNASNAVKIGQMDVPNCRYITFDGNYAYVSSYVGTVGDPACPLGEIYKVDLNTLKTVARCTVGYQPEEMAITDGKLYVANSGGYRIGIYDNTVSEISLSTFQELRKIPVALNLHHLKLDSHGQMWVSNRGDYGAHASKMYVLDASDGTMAVRDSVNIACSNFAISGDSIYIISFSFNDYTQSNAVSYGLVNARSHQLVSSNFITDGTESSITIPYGIGVNTSTGDIYVSDAKNYVSSGTLSCYGRGGKRKWKVQTGDIPAHFVLQ